MPVPRPPTRDTRKHEVHASELAHLHFASAHFPCQALRVLNARGWTTRRVGRTQHMPTEPTTPPKRTTPAGRAPNPLARPGAAGRDATTPCIRTCECPPEQISVVPVLARLKNTHCDHTAVHILYYSYWSTQACFFAVVQSARARVSQRRARPWSSPPGPPGGQPPAAHAINMPPPCDFASDNEPRRAMICRQAQRNSPRREGCGSGPGSSPCSGSGADSSRMEPPRTGGMGRSRAHRTSTSLALHNGGPNGSRLSAVRLFVFVNRSRGGHF